MYYNISFNLVVDQLPVLEDHHELVRGVHQPAETPRHPRPVPGEDLVRAVGEPGPPRLLGVMVAVVTLPPRLVIAHGAVLEPELERDDGRRRARGGWRRRRKVEGILHQESAGVLQVHLLTGGGEDGVPGSLELLWTELEDLHLAEEGAEDGAHHEVVVSLHSLEVDLRRLLAAVMFGQSQHLARAPHAQHHVLVTLILHIKVQGGFLQLY